MVCSISKTECLLDPWNLDHPSHVGRVDLLLDKPCGEVLPLAGRSAVNRQTGFSILILALLQLCGNFLKQTRKPHRKPVRLFDKTEVGT